MLSIEDTQKIIEQNLFEVDSAKPLLSRCCDEILSNSDDSITLPLVKPGGECGELVTALSTNREYELGLTDEEIIETVLETVGGKKNFITHAQCYFLDLVSAQLVKVGLGKKNV